MTLKPIVFISYHSAIDAFQVQHIADYLRKQNIKTFISPFDIDDSGYSLLKRINSLSTQPIMLALAISRESCKDKWVIEIFKDKIIKALENISLEHCVLKLVDFQENILPSYLIYYQEFDLSGENYENGLKKFIDYLGYTIERKLKIKENYYSLSGTFEPVRTSPSLFAQLKKEIDMGIIDQKYLYWDVRGAIRWQRIAESSTYTTAQTSMNLLVSRGGSIVENIISDTKKAENYNFLNFGVGTGVKDYLLLKKLVNQTGINKVLYFAIDESLSMIQITISALEELMAQYQDKLKVNFILDDFVNVDRFKKYIYQEEKAISSSSETIRIIGFLGGSIGNFDEIKILPSIKALMSTRDYLLLGVEYIANRSNQELIENYSDIIMKEFLFGPIKDVEGAPPNWQNLFYYDVIESPSKYSCIENSKTVIGLVTYKGHSIQLFSSTKYEKQGFEEFLKQQGFSILSSYASEEKIPYYEKYLLKLKNNNKK